MKKTKIAIILLLILTMLVFAGCGDKQENGDAADQNTNGGDTAGTDADGGNSGADGSASFSYSDGIDENGLWDGVTALDYVKLCEYKNIPVPASVHEIDDEKVQEQIDTILGNYAESVQVTDRAIVDGDTVNIDYVGSIGGVEFEGGSTGGAGTDVTIGVTQYIDDFLEQLIGHTPGEAFDIEVTFPDDYGKAELAGKDAVFAIEINYITESVKPELNDGFVSEKLSGTYGWTTVEEMKNGIHDDLRDKEIGNYITDYIIDNSTVSEVPESVMEGIEHSMLAYYEQYAVSYSLNLDEFLSNYVGYDSAEELIEAFKESNQKTAEYYLILQAIAEDAGITANKDDISKYFSENMGISDYTSYEQTFGLPYLMQVTLYENVLDHVVQSAELE